MTNVKSIYMLNRLFVLHVIIFLPTVKNEKWTMKNFKQISKLAFNCFWLLCNLPNKLLGRSVLY